MRRTELDLDGRRAYVWVGGEGEAVLLLHGVWAGAELHWARVWDQLSASHRLIAPDFPGLAYESTWWPRSFDQAARWIRSLMELTDTPRAWIVGSSFGAALGARVASTWPERTLGLVLVDGAPPPTFPGAVASLLKRWPLRPVMEALFQRMAFGPSMPQRAFADPVTAPGDLIREVSQRHPRQLEVTSEILLAGDRATPPLQSPTLVVWGEEDKLPGSTVKTARRLERKLPHARLVTIPGAGHLPQVEKPQEFVDAVRSFFESGGDGRGEDYERSTP